VNKPARVAVRTLRIVSGVAIIAVIPVWTITAALLSVTGIGTVAGIVMFMTLPRLLVLVAICFGARKENAMAKILSRGAYRRSRYGRARMHMSWR
jgi:hypothetical protein